MQEFARHGYDGARMDGIAAAASITKPVLYDHFPSKQALFLAVLTSIRDGLIARGQAIVDAPSEPVAKFRRAVAAFLEFVEQEPDAARVLLTVPGDPMATKLSLEVQAGASAGIAALLATFLPDAVPWRREVASVFLKEGLHAAAIWWLEHPGTPREELVDAITRLAWPGLKAEGRLS